MMLQALYELAQREGLLDDPDFERHRVDLRLRVGRDGRFLSLEQVSEGRDVLTTEVPRPPKRSGLSVRPGLLFDVSGYALGAGKDAANRLAAFRDLARQVGQATRDPGVRAVGLLLGRSDQVRAVLASRHEWTGREWVGFVVEGDGDLFVHERTAVRAYWSDQRAKAGGERPLMRCLVTGELVEPVRLHCAVKMPGTKGAVLVSFNEDSACFRGLEQGDNAPIGRAAAEGYVTALNWLLERTATRHHRQAVSLGEGDVLVFWTREPDPVVEILHELIEPEPVAKLVSLPWTGQPLPELGSTTFYAAILGTNRTRIIVRSWIETTVSALRENIRRYAEDLRIDEDASQPPTVGALLRSVDGSAGRVPPAVAAGLVRAALFGSPFPRPLLGAALRRVYLPAIKSGPWVLRTRCALIKAALLRSPSAQEVPVSLDESKADVPYLLGRLFAVIERMQYQAHGTLVDTSVRDRFFRSAASTPAMVFPRLIALSGNHAAKIRARGKGSFLEVRKAEIMDRLPAAPLPATMPLEAQGLFAIGYYHQRQRLFRHAEPAVPESPTRDAVTSEI